MKKIKFILVLIVSTIVSLQIHAQQDPQFTQYFDNALFVNPAYAGSTGMLSALTIHREQWVGFEGRPSSTTMSIHSPLSYESVGLGLTAVRDVIGPLSQTMFYGDFSYSLKLTQKSKTINENNSNENISLNVDNNTYINLKQDIFEIKNEIIELKKTLKECIDIIKSVYEFENS